MKPYPPTSRWRHLTRPEQRERMETSADLLALLQWHRGDPRASAWEEAFLTSVVRQIEAFHGAAPLSEKQWDKVWQVLDKLGADFPAAGSGDDDA